MKKLIAITLIFLFVGCAYGQSDCYFKIDTNKILQNKNLDLFIRKIEGSTFKISRNKNEMPRYIRAQLTCLIGDTLLANPNEKYNLSDVLTEGDVTRKFIFFAQSQEICIVVYESGGIGSIFHTLFMRVWDDRIVDIWSGLSFKEPNNIKDILTYINENRVKGKMWRLNSDFLYY